MLLCHAPCILAAGQPGSVKLQSTEIKFKYCLKQPGLAMRYQKSLLGNPTTIDLGLYPLVIFVVSDAYINTGFHHSRASLWLARCI